MNSAISSYLRFPLALALGLLINGAVFTMLRNLTSVSFDVKPIQATRIEFTRLHRDTETATKHTEDRAVRDVMPDVPNIPQMATENLHDAPNVVALIPQIDVNAALKSVGMSMGLESAITALVRFPPLYPHTAKVAKIEGYVTMDVVVNPDGSVADIHVVDAAPPRLFDMAAVDAMKRWKFQPKVVNGSPVSQRAQQTIEFRLSEEGG